MWSSISAVIPVYNSRDSLDELYIRLTKEFYKLCDDFEIILVDDGSKDYSYKKMLQLHNKDSRVKAIQLDGNFGQQNALMCGFQYANGDYVVTLDDDLQHLPEEIEKLLNKLDEGYDVAFGIPRSKKHSFYRNIGSKMTGFLFTKICSKPRDVKISSFRVIKKDIIEKIIQDKTSFVYISAIIYKFTNNIGNVQVKHDIRKHGESNYNFVKLVKLFIKLYIYYSNSLISRLFTLSGSQFIIKNSTFTQEK